MSSEQEATTLLNDSEAPTWKRRWQKWRPLLLGFIVMVAMGYWVGWATLWQSLAAAELIYVLPALLLLALSGLVAGWRWHLAVTRLFDLSANLPLSLRLYGESMSLAFIVPGAQATGDIWRTLRLYRFNQKNAAEINPRSNALWLSCLYSVVWDRAMGLWSMFFISLLGTLWLYVNDTQFSQMHGHLQLTVLMVEGLAVLGLPLFLLLLPLTPTAWRRWRILQPWLMLHQRLLAHPWVALAIVLQSMVVLAFTALTWGFALKAINPDTSIMVGIATAAPIFVAASLPVSMGGWGTREVAAVQMMASFGFTAAEALSASVLLGGIYTLFALIISPLFLWKHQPPLPTVG